MDKEQARFVLRCFRPGGADAGDPEIAEALELAATDRELGEWLARERAADREFAAMLERMELPGNLREEILQGLAAERGDLPGPDEFDHRMAAALAGVAPPAGMREELLVAMRASRPASQPVAAARGGGGRSGWWRFGMPLAAAAGIALAFVLTRPDGAGGPAGPTASGGEAATAGLVPVSFVENQAIAALESADFALDFRDEDVAKLFRQAREQGRPCPQGCLPKGLKRAPGVGCHLLEFDGKRGAIYCLRSDDQGVVHIVVFRRAAIDGELPDAGHPALSRHGQWSVARWQDSNRAFLLLSKGSEEQLGGLF